MKPVSAGLLMFRRKPELQVLLAHPGGPFWAKKDAGAWGIPKGLIEEDESPLVAAIREFSEETGLDAQGPFLPIGEVRLKSGKFVHGWAFEGDADASTLRSNLIVIEWPPHSGRQIEIPEVDRFEWFTLEKAREKINPGQMDFLERLLVLKFQNS